MKRNPSIHVLLSDFVEILRKEGLENPQALAERIFRSAVPYSIKDRYIISGDSETRKQARRIMAASGTKGIPVEKFNRWLTSIRMSEGHRGVIPLKQTNTSDWTLLREVTQISNEFSEVSGLQAEEGCKIFISLGLKLMKRNYSLGKFKYYREKINTLYIAADMVENDPKKEDTKEVYHIWHELMKQYGNFAYKLDKFEQYVNMVYVRMEADAVGANYRDWLVAQFEWFQILATVPTLTQLITEAALDRYYEYMSKKRGNKKAIRNDKTDYQSDFDKRYFQAVRSKIEET